MFVTNHKREIRTLCKVFVLIYAGVLVYFLFFCQAMGRTMVEAGYRFNLIPLREIFRFLTYRDQLGAGAVWMNLEGNILIFIPFGLLLPIMYRKMKEAGRVIVLALLISLTVETIQLITRTGSFDVDDLILNTLGAAAGYLVYMILQYVRDRRADRRRAALRYGSGL